jgi:hypothetical protein
MVLGLSTSQYHGDLSSHVLADLSVTGTLTSGLTILTTTRRCTTPAATNVGMGHSAA